MHNAIYRTKRLWALITIGLFSFLFPESKAQTTANLPEITSRMDTAEGWCDIFLTVTADTKTTTGHRYIAKGMYHGKVVGLQIEISGSIGAGIVDGRPGVASGFLKDAVRFTSIGRESDELVKALAGLYKQPAGKGFTKTVVSATVFSLNDKAVDLDKKDQYKLKLFFGGDNEQLYAELFMNVNTEKGEIELNEKDQSYRADIIRVLTK